MLPEGEVKLVISRAPSGAGALTVAVGVALGVGFQSLPARQFQSAPPWG